jgi:chromate transport protein ChrA
LKKALSASQVIHLVTLCLGPVAMSVFRKILGISVYDIPGNLLALILCIGAAVILDLVAQAIYRKYQQRKRAKECRTEEQPEPK